MALTYDLCIVVPFLNEEENIPFLINGLNDIATNLSPNSLEIIFVDDGSQDNSVLLLVEAKNKTFPCRIIKLSKNCGSHAAIRAGLKNSNSKFTTILSADLQDPISIIQDLYHECQSGVDIAYGQRRSVKEQFFVSLFSRFYAKLMQKFVAPNYPQNGVDVVMMNRKVTDLLNKNIEGNSNFVLQLLSFGFKTSFIEYDKSERKEGKSKWTLSKKIKLFIDSFIAFSFVPIRLVTTMGFVFSTIGVFWTSYVVLREIIYGDISPGWPSLVAILLLGFGVTNIGLGIIAEYLWRTLDSTRDRPVFIIDEIIELDNASNK